MENCLVKEYKAVVNNDNLEVLGAFKMHAVEIVGNTDDHRVRFKAADGDIKVEIKGNGALQESAALLVSNPLTEITIASNTYKEVYFSNGTYTILLHNKYELKEIRMDYARKGNDLIHFGDISKLKNSTKLTFVDFNKNKYVIGNVRDILDNANGVQISALETPLTGEISPTDNVNVRGTKCYGDFTGMLRTATHNDKAFMGYYDGVNYVCDGNITGDISVTPVECDHLLASTATIYPGNTDSFWNVSWKGTRSSESKIMGLQYFNFGTDLDAMLVNQANCVANGGSGTTANITVKGTHTMSDVTWQAAVATLKQKGMNVVINGETL